MKNKLREYRLQKGWTQAELARRVSVSARTIISLETGRYNPSLLLAYRLSRELEAGMEELYCLEENLREEETE